MFNRKAKQARVTTKAAKTLDTGRISGRNKVNAHTEARRQANWRKKFS